MANAKQDHWLNIREPRLFWSSVICFVKLLMLMRVQVLTHGHTYNSAAVDNIEKLLESARCSQKSVGAAGVCTVGEPNEVCPRSSTLSFFSVSTIYDVYCWSLCSCKT